MGPQKRKQRGRRREPWEDGGRPESDAATSQGRPQVLDKAGKDVPRAPLG